jgi:hypothetical protein
LLVGCGGGGSDTSTAVPVSVTPVAPGPLVNQPAVTKFSLEENNHKEAGVLIESTALNTSEVVVPDGFILISERSFTLKITRSEDDNQPAYLSLCSDYQQLSDRSYSINYDSCLLRTSLSDESFEAVITVTNNTVGLVAALWFMNCSKEPIIRDWQL